MTIYTVLMSSSTRRYLFKSNIHFFRSPNKQESQVVFFWLDQVYHK